MPHELAVAVQRGHQRSPGRYVDPDLIAAERHRPGTGHDLITHHDVVGTRDWQVVATDQPAVRREVLNPLIRPRRIHHGEHVALADGERHGAKDTSRLLPDVQHRAAGAPVGIDLMHRVRTSVEDQIVALPRRHEGARLFKGVDDVWCQREDGLQDLDGTLR